MKYRENVPGAPFKIGDRVKVLKGVDDTFAREFEGKEGEVTALNYDDTVGQRYPDDPLIIVKMGPEKEQSFWKEELCII